MPADPRSRKVDATVTARRSAAERPLPRFGIVGFGEIGTGLAALLRKQAMMVIAYDILLESEDGTPSDPIRRRAAKLGVTLAGGWEEFADCNVVLSAVTPPAAVAVAARLAPIIGGDAYFADLNSCHPALKEEVCAAFPADGARVVDCCIGGGGLSLDGYCVPIYVAGPDAGAFVASLAPTGLNLRSIGSNIGDAARLKMLRSVLTKGLEAAAVEMICAAAQLGLETAVIESVADPVDRHGLWNFMEMQLTTLVKHARRRSQEMGMVAEYLRELDVDPMMVDSTQRRIALIDAGSQAAGGPPPVVARDLSEAAATLLRLTGPSA